MTGKGIVVAAVTVALLAASFAGDVGMVPSATHRHTWDALATLALLGSALWVAFGKED